MICTRCNATGFLNLEQVDDETLAQFDKTGDTDLILAWINERNTRIERGDCTCHISPPCSKCEAYHDVQVCDCCGDGENWHGTPGGHNNWQDGKEPPPDCI